MEQLRALSVRQPWAHSIVHHRKDIENRTRRFGHRGWTLIHASAGHTAVELDRASEFRSDAGLPHPAEADLRFGGIIGVARIIDCIDAGDLRARSPWWMGPYGLLIDAARPLPFVPCKGTVTPLFWTPAPETMDALRPALRALALPELAA